MNRMIVGDSSRNVDLTSPSQLVFAANELAFEPMATYLTALHGFVSLLAIYKPGPEGPAPWRPTDVAIFDGAACDVRLVWSPHHVVVPMLLNAWPVTVEFQSFSADPIPPGSVLNLGVVEHFIFGLGQQLLTNFVEGRKAVLRSTYGKVTNWPPIWNFGRVVRNAMSHGGRIRIDDRSVVHWRNLTYSDADNGNPIINVDLWPADLFILVKEMEAALPTP